MIAEPSVRGAIDAKREVDGEKGDDSLTGQDGADTFVFRTGTGKDTVTDFGTGSGSAFFANTFAA